MNATFRLLHVEDDDNDAMFLENAVRRSGRPCVLKRAHNGVEAVNFFKQIAAPETQTPHIVISDLKMPGMNGIEFCRWLKKSRFSCIPFVLLTGSMIDGDVVKAYQCGANSFATKPVNVHQLNEMVGTILKYWNDVCNVTGHAPALVHGACAPIN